MSGSCCARGFDIIVNNVKVVTNFSPERDQGGIHHSGAEANTGLFGQPPPPPSTASSAAIVDYTFTAQSPSLSIELNGDDGVSSSPRPCSHC